MYEPSEEEKKIIAEMEKRREQQKKVPPAERRVHPRPERFDFPIGVDDQGRAFPVDDEDRESKQDKDD